jgi:hypothetical protein
MRFWMCVLWSSLLIHGLPSSNGELLLETTPTHFGYLEISEKFPGCGSSSMRMYTDQSHGSQSWLC